MLKSIIMTEISEIWEYKGCVVKQAGIREDEKEEIKMLQWFCENHRSKSNDLNFFFIFVPFVEPPSRAQATYTYLLNIYSHKYENGSKNNNEKPFMKTNCHLNNITKEKRAQIFKFLTLQPFFLLPCE